MLKMIKNPKKDILEEERNVRYHERIPSNKKEILKVFLQEQFQIHFFELEHLIKLKRLPDYLIGGLFDARTLT